MPELPEDLRRALHEHTDEAPRAALRTTTRQPCGPLGRPQTHTEVWVAVTAHRVWVLAACGTGPWVRGDGAGDSLRLEPGWTAHTLHAAGQVLTVAARDRAAAEQAVEAWALAPRGGSPVASPAPDAAPPTRARAARAAVLPEGWAQAVPAPVEARWLHVVPTAARHEVVADGRRRALPVEVGIRDDGLALAVREGARLHAWREVHGPLTLVRRGGRPGLEGEDLTLPGALVGGSEALLVHLSSADPSARWAWLARHAADADDPGRATAAWVEADERGQADACWLDVAAACCAADLPGHGRAALGRALLAGALHAGDPGAWTRAATAWGRRAAWRRHTGALREGLGPLLGPLLPSEPGLEPARAAWLGALEDHARRGDTLEDWRRAAVAWHEAHVPARALACLDEAVRTGGPAERWLQGAWRWEEGQRAAGTRAWRQALAADPEGAALQQLPDADAWRALGALAEAAGAEELAARAWAQVRAAAPADPEVARRLATALLAVGKPERAATVLAELATSADDHGLDTPALWREVASLRQGPDREAAARQSVACGFLHAHTFAAARGLEGVDEPTRTWWAHLERVVGGSQRPEAPGRPPAAELGRADQEAIAPGAPSWLANLSEAVLGPPLPDRAALVRGLEPLEGAMPEAQAVVRALALSLQTAAPEAFLFRGDGAWGVAAWPTRPPVLLLGAAHAPGGPRALSSGPLRFALATTVAHLACGHPAPHADPSLAGTSRQVYRAFGRYAGVAEDVVDLLTLVPGVDHLARLERVVRASRRVFAARKALDKAGKLATPLVDRALLPTGSSRGLGPLGLSGARLRAQLHADRLALRLTGDMGAAVAAILLTSTGSADLAARVHQEGLAAVLQDPTGPVGADETVRVSALLAWAATTGPALDAP